MSQKRMLSIYLLPNILTSGTLFAGFYAIVAAFNNDFYAAAISVNVAIIMDLLDGRVARLTNTQTEFGAEYDSLADIVAFGVAPSLVAYTWGLHELHKIGWLLAFIYVATGALRLARFNTQQLDPIDKNYFIGMPIPTAAAITANFTWIASHYGQWESLFYIVLGLLMFLISFLMISNVKYYSFKQVELKGRIPFLGGAIVVLIFAFISLQPPIVVFLAFSGYAIIAPIFALLHDDSRKSGDHNEPIS